jgi:hypothetical protein
LVTAFAGDHRCSPANARNRLSGYVLAMSNRYGITFDSAFTEWAAQQEALAARKGLSKRLPKQ